MVKLSTLCSIVQMDDNRFGQSVATGGLGRQTGATAYHSCCNYSATLI